jgi:FkbM family methyltransferase
VYEPSFYQAFVGRIKEGMTVFDIGAHIGLFTLGAAKRVGKRGRVYAFESSQETAEILDHHVRLNGWQNRVEVVRAVVSDVDGVGPFYAHGLSMAASLGR